MSRISFARKFVFFAVLAVIASIGFFAFQETAGAVASPDTFGIKSIEDNTVLGVQNVRVTVAKIIRAVLGLLGIIAVVLVIYAGITVMTAGGNEEKVETGKKILINAVIGLAIILASFAIVQFVLSRLSQATGSGTVPPPTPEVCKDLNYAASHREECDVKTPPDFDCDANPAWCQGDKFIVRSLTPRTDNTVAGNVVIRAVFSRPVATAPDSVLTILRDGGNANSQFNFAFIAGNRILEATIKPEFSACGASLCIPKGTYVMDVMTGAIQDTAGKTLEASFNSTLHATFTVPENGRLDAQEPTVNTFTVKGFANEVVNAARGSVYPVTVGIIDDSGIGYVMLTVAKDGGATLLTDYYGPIKTSNATAAQPYAVTYPLALPKNIPVGDTYVVSITAYDIDHRSATVSKQIRVIPEHCNNGVQDEDETAVDAGGSCSSETSCTDNAQCRSGFCDVSIGRCVVRPQITGLSPDWEGAPGNWVTIIGFYFGSKPGLVEFGYDTNNSQTIDEGDTWVPAVLPSCGAASTWKDGFIVAQVPENNAELLARIQDSNPLKQKRAIRVTREKIKVTDPALRDSSVDDVGPRPGGSAGYFTINDVSRPGICQVLTAGGENSASPDTPVTITGRGFGNNGQTGAVTFSGLAAEKTSWSDASIGAKVVRNLTPGLSAVAVSVNNRDSNSVPFTILSANEEEFTPDVQAVDPVKTTRASFITITGQRFTQSGVVYLAPRSGMKCAAGDGCVPLSMPPIAMCGLTWSDSQIVVQLPEEESIALGDYYVVVKNVHDRFSDGKAKITIEEGPAAPSICGLSPDHGGAPLPEGSAGVKIIGFNFSLKPTVYFWKGGADPADLRTWFSAANFISAANDKIETLLPVDEQGNSLPVGPSPIRVQAHGQVSNRVMYTVDDCTQSSTVPEGKQCCASGPDKGVLKNAKDLCAVSPGEIREAGYVWRFTTGLIPRLPFVVEECNVADWDKVGAEIQFPSPTPWREQGNGLDACLDSTIALRFSLPMSPDSLNQDTVKVFTCATQPDGNSDCAPTAKQPVNVSDLSLGYASQILTIRSSPPAGDLLPDTWYRIELSDKIVSAENVNLLGQISTVNKPLVSTRPCGAGTAYCFEFKTMAASDAGTDRCELLDAGIAPPIHTARRLGLVDVPSGSGSPLYYFVWGRGLKACSVFNVDAMGWKWRSENENKAAVTQLPYNGAATTYATADAIQNTVPGNVKITAATTNDPAKVYTGSTTLMVDLGEPEVVEFWPSCDEACTNATFGLRFNRHMKQSTFAAGVQLFECADGESCARYVEPAVPLLEVQKDFFTYEFKSAFDFVPESPGVDLKPNTWYRVVALPSILSLGMLDNPDTDQNEERDGNPLVPYKGGKFRTKEQSCYINSVRLEPDPFTARQIGQKTRYTAAPYGSPDKCSALGQKLDAWSYFWQWQTDNEEVASVSRFSSVGVLRPYCSSNCLPLGSDIARSVTLPAVCGDGIVDSARGEDCDIAEMKNGQLTESAASCTFRCLRPGNPARGTGVSQCGNGIVEPMAGEECEVGVEGATNETCSEQCLNVGSANEYSGRVEKPYCGSGQVTAGEDCDKKIHTIGCDARCLHTGTPLSQAWCDVNPGSDNVVLCAGAMSVCGNGKLEAGEECDAPGDSCSSQCLFQDNICGTPFAQCVAGADGCNDDCRLQGSSVLYGVSSLCGDGEDGAGEYAGAAVPNGGFSCELPRADEAKGQNPVQVVTAVGETEPAADTKSQVTKIRAGAKGKEGVADYALQCGYVEFVVSDFRPGQAAYNDCPNSDGGVKSGVAANSCCYARPKRVSEYPSDGTGIEGIPGPIDAFAAQVTEFGLIYEKIYFNAYNRLITRRGFDFSDLYMRLEEFSAARSNFLATPAEARTEGQMENVAETLGNLSEILDIFIIELDDAETYRSERVSVLLRDKIDRLTREQAALEEDISALPALKVAPVREQLAAVARSLEENKYDVVPASVRESLMDLRIFLLGFERLMSAATPETLDSGQVDRLIEQFSIKYDEFINSTNGYSDESSPVISFEPLRLAVEQLKTQYDGAHPVNPVCRNTYISATFDGYIDKESIYNNIIIAKGYESGFSCVGAGQKDVSDLVRNSFGNEPEEIASADRPNIFVRAWQAVKRFFGRLFGRSVYASKFDIAAYPVWCSGSVTAVPNLAYEQIDASKWRTELSLQIGSVLDSDSIYSIVIIGGRNGVLDNRGVGARNPSADGLIDSWTFKTGKEICKIDEITVNPSSHLFNAPNTTKPFTAFAKSRNGYIVPIPRQYDWEWSWGPANHPVFAIPAPDMSPTSSRVAIGVKGVEGRSTAVTSARVTLDAIDGADTERVFTGMAELTASFCERPWPHAQFPYRDDVYNFSMSYCADAGVSGKTEDDLPYLAETPIRLVDREGSKEDVGADVLKKSYFVNDKNDDVIGVQIFRNDFGTVEEWYKKNPRNFKNAANLRSVTTTGYEALTDGSNYYIGALDEVKSSDGQTRVFRNIYLFSVNPDAQTDTKRVFERLLQTLEFNTNITNLGYCLAQGGDLHASPAQVSATPCADDFACRDANGTAKPGHSGVCSNAKTKFRNDWQRLQDIRTAQDRLSLYQTANGTYPALDSGSFIQHYTAGYWSVSWSALGRAIGGAPQDPVNKKSRCEDLEADQETCWNAKTTTYSCPGYGSVYEYSYLPATKDYMLHGKLEYFALSDKIVTDIIDENHFSASPWCKPSERYNPFSARCGDGVVNPATEECDSPNGIFISDKGIVTPQFVNGKCDFQGRDISCAASEDCRYFALKDNVRLPMTGTEQVCSILDVDDTDQDATNDKHYPLYKKLSASLSAEFISCSADADCQRADAYQADESYVTLGKGIVLAGEKILEEFRLGRQDRYRCLPLNGKNLDIGGVPIQIASCKGEIGGAVEKCLPGTFATKRCADTCKLAYSQCAAINVCGNGIVETGEACDDGSLNGTPGHCLGGALKCTGFDNSCGNGQLDAAEFCDKAAVMFSKGYCSNINAPVCNGGTSERWHKVDLATVVNLSDVFAAGRNAWTLGNNGRSGVFLRSVNKTSWNDITAGFSLAANYPKKVFFLSENAGWAIGGQTNGKDVFTRTEDGGVTWKDTIEVSGVISDIFMLNEDLGWAVGRPFGGEHADKGIIWKKTGANWDRVKDGLTDAQFQPSQGRSMALEKIFFLNNQVGWILSKHVLLLTKNGGGSWEPVDPMADVNLSVYSDVHFFNENSGLLLVLSPVLDISSILKTSNGGKNWELVGNYPGVQFKDIDFGDGQNGIVVGTNGFAMSTSDGGKNWIQNKLGTNSLYQAELGQGGQGWTVGTNGTLYSTYYDCSVRACSFDADCGSSSLKCLSAKDPGYDLERKNSCSWDCRAPGGYCGDGIPQSAEQCEDGNTVSGDGCSKFCRKEVSPAPVDPTVAQNTARCGDGIVQAQTEMCDIGDKNGVRCAPEYDASCTYCASDCREVLTVDPDRFCGNGRIDRIRGSESAPVTEACDVLPGGQIIASAPSASQPYATATGLACAANLVGSYECNETCTGLTNTCVACGILENKGAIPKVAVINVLTASSTAQNAEWGKQTWKALYRAGANPPERLAIMDGSTPYRLKSNWTNYTAGTTRDGISFGEADYRNYMLQQWVFLGSLTGQTVGARTLQPWPSDPVYINQTSETGSPFYGIETNQLCKDQYKIGFNNNSTNWDSRMEPGDLFDYPVNGGTIVENELVITPAVPANTFRAVVRWPVNDTGIKLSLGVYNEGFARTTTFTYLDAITEPARRLCTAMRLDVSWIPACEGYENSSLQIHDIGQLTKTGAHTVSLTPLKNSANADAYAVFVQGLRGPIGQYASLLGEEDIVVDLYMHDPAKAVYPQYAILKPTRSFSFKAASELSTNPRARYWHVFNLVKRPSGWQVEPVGSGEQGSVETGFRDVQCNLPDPYPCPEPPPTEG